jgi:hypothetical protein
MVKLRNNIYRGHVIKKIGRGKKVVFTAVIHGKEWATMIESDLKKKIDAEIDKATES